MLQAPQIEAQSVIGEVRAATRRAINYNIWHWPKYIGDVRRAQRRLDPTGETPEAQLAKDTLGK